MIKIDQAKSIHLNDLALLFDAYRVFYNSPSDINGALAFLQERISNGDSVIYIAYIEEIAVGFTQIYPMFSSVSMQRLFVLNDLYVHPNYRGKGIGEALLNIGKKYTIDNQGKSLILETAKDNPAQKLYERLGWKKYLDFFHYTWTP